MLENGFESRIKIQQIIENQLPEFILDENPKAAEFLKQYYISQEFQSGPVDIAENLDQYLNLDHLIPEVIANSTSLQSDITSTSTTIFVNHTKGFPQRYGLLQIDDEIITYTDSTENSFIGCVRGFSGITNYHQDLKYEELVFNTSSSASHKANTSVKNLSSLFLKEFYRKIKFALTPGLENVNFIDELNVGNFVRNARTFYQTKGTPESFRILFNVLFGETPKVIDLEQFLIKSSDANYIRRDIAVVEKISGNPTKLVGQTITKTTDSATTASVSKVETISRKNKTYYKLYCFVGYDDTYPTITGTFSITESTRVIENAIIRSVTNPSVITVDSTIGFEEQGSFYYENNEIFYTSKSINQFFGCYTNQSIPINITKTGVVRSKNTYYGYEDGDISKKVEFRITGVLSNLEIENKKYNFFSNEEISPKNVGECILFGSSQKQIFANSWIYNTSSRFQIESYNNITITLKTTVDSTNLRVGDTIEILKRNTQTVFPGFENVKVVSISDSKRTIEVNVNTSLLNSSGEYDIRRKIKKANCLNVPLEFGNNTLFSDIQNVYDDESEYMYVASQSLPSYTIDINTLKYDAYSVIKEKDTDTFCSVITFRTPISFITGDKVYYSTNNNQLLEIEDGIYYVKVLADKKSIKLYQSKSAISANDFIIFELTSDTILMDTHTFVLYSQQDNLIAAKKVLKKFKLNPNISDNQSYSTIPGTIGMLRNGVEILNYKSNDKIYYGPIENIDVLNSGTDYDVINPPQLQIVSGSALLQPVIVGSVKEVYVDPQDFNIDSVISIDLTGGNGSGAVFKPVIEKTVREIEFDARNISNGGGLDIVNERLSFLQSHNLINGQPIVYSKNNNLELGIGSFDGSNNDQFRSLIDGAVYYTKVLNDKTIQLYQSLSDYNSGINTVGFTTVGNSGIHKFKTEPKTILKEIKVIQGGKDYTNRKLRVSSTGISTADYTINYKDHGFSDGELIEYSYENTGISGISTFNQYYVLKINSDKFKICNAGIGGTDTTDYNQKRYIKFSNTGSGYQIFKYPDIKLSVSCSLAGIGNTNSIKVISATPIVRGSISQVYVYEKGSDYGSNILNVHQRPRIIVKNGTGAQFTPIISNGRIVDVSVQYGGSDYYSIPDLTVIGNGVGAVLKAVVENNKIVDVIVINTGIGYDSNQTSVIAVPVGKGSVLQANVRALTLNNVFKYGIQKDTYRDPCSELLLGVENKLQYTILSYSDKVKSNIQDDGSNVTNHSPIIGWAYDGNPIYGPYGYSDPSNANSSIKKLESGYTRNQIENRPNISQFPYDYFVEDFVYTNSGDLDQYNGRFCKTKDFPNGTYAYFTSVETNVDGQLIGKFPYFVGNEYRSKILEENTTLDQSFDFNNSKLIRNTTPYKVNDPYADNDFIIESNEITRQKTIIESVTSGTVDGFEIIKAGTDYSVGDSIIFDETNTNGSGVNAKVSEIKGKNVVSLQTTVDEYQNCPIVWEKQNQLRVYVFPYHNLSNNDNIVISGLSTQISSVNGKYSIRCEKNSTTIAKEITNYSGTGKYVDIYLANLPKNVSIGSSVQIDNEIFSIINTFPEFNIIRTKRSSSGVAHSEGSNAQFLSDSFLIDKSIQYFDSEVSKKLHFNPTESLGIGTTNGSGILVTYNVGITTYNTFIPTQSIFLPNHSFKTGEKIILRKDINSSPIAVKINPSDLSFNILSGTSQTLYAINKSKNFIGIATDLNSTSSSDGLYFVSSGTDNYEYSIENIPNQIVVDTNKINTLVSLTTSHNLNYGDHIKLNVSPNLSVGIGTSSSITVKYNATKNKLLINPIQFLSGSIDTDANSIQIISHTLNTGDKVLLESSGNYPSGLNNTEYFVYKIDENHINLCESYIDSISSPPLVVNIQTTGTGTHTLSLINPPLKFIKNNNIVFDLKDSSLVGYTLNLYTDLNLNKKFVSISNSEFTVIQNGAAGISSTATLTLRYSDNIPNKLYYGLEKSGMIVLPDTEVSSYSEISYEDSYYNGNYTITNTTENTFSISLSNYPERLNYEKEECDILEYYTTSSTEKGSISKISLISGGYGYKSVPLFVGVESLFGSGAEIIPSSETIGKISQSKIFNEGFEYSSDKTLRPTANISKIAYTSASNTIESVDVLNGGKNYISAPNLVCVDSDTGELINSGLLKAILSGSSISFVEISSGPKGLPNKPVTIRSINNSNGVTINGVTLNGSIVSCTISTPLLGFTNIPFSVGDKIFVEGIEKIGESGDGFNSADYGYKFFTVSNFYNLIPAIVEFDISDFSDDPGVPLAVQYGYASLVNYNNYPEFKVSQIFSPFLIGEKLWVNENGVYKETDLVITYCNQNFIKVIGNYALSINDKVKGEQSLNEATISLINEINGKYEINYFNRQNIDWQSNTGKLSDDTQFLPDNDYYQNLSYSVKSSKTWEEIVTPVNNLLHTSGLKNFADMQIISKTPEKDQVGINTTPLDNVFIKDFISDLRVDTIPNFDLVTDVDVIKNRSKFLKFNTTYLSDYILCKTNRVLAIDDISDQFSSYDDERSSEAANILSINPINRYNKFLILIKNTLNNETQFTELVTINNNENIYNLVKGNLSSVNNLSYLVNPSGYVTEDLNFYLKFEPTDPYNSSFNIKILQDIFTDNTGIATQSIGFVDLIGANESALANASTSILQFPITKYKSIYANFHILNNDGSRMNYVEIYLTHDDTNSYISEYYFDNFEENNSSSMGSFISNISNGILSLNYTNNTENTVNVKGKYIALGNTNIGIGTYRFKLDGQIDGNERTVVFNSNTTNSIGSTTIISLDKNIFSATKSVVRIGYGNTSALHQVMTIFDGNNVYTTEYPFLSIGSTTGIGTFGGNIVGNNINVTFYPDSSINSNVEVLSFSESFYKDLDKVNIPPNLVYSCVTQSVKYSNYYGINSQNIDKLDFDMNYQTYPIFAKTFNPSDSNIVNLSTGQFNIPNHFFSTGEKIIYTPKSSFIGVGTAPMGIGATLNHVGLVTTLLPTVVYAIKDDNSNFRLATRKEYALAGIGVTFTSVGIGNAHELEMNKKNEKCIIAINNLIQYPIRYTYITHTLSGNGGQIGTASTIFALSGIGTIRPTDLLRIENEYVKVTNVGFGTTNSGPITFSGNIPLVEVVRGFVGSVAAAHTDSTLARVYRGSYNVSGSKIYFTQAPRGNSLDLIFPDERNLKRERATFNGRVFLRNDYTSNQVYDDISDQFTGVDQTFTLTSQGINTVGLGTAGGNGIVLINSIFQAPTTLNNSKNNYFIKEDLNLGITSITFTGITSTNTNTNFISDFDINQNQLPRGGIIVSLGSSSGLGYAPLVGASVTAVVNSGSIVSVGLGTTDILGSGYRNPVSVAVTESGHTGNPAIITADVIDGGALSFNVIDGGTDYINPIINVSSPNYENLPIVGVSRLGIGNTSDTGIGLLMNVEVGSSSTTGIGSTLFEVKSFKITRNGYAFERGDVFKPVGLVTAVGLSQPISEFQLTVLDTFSDSFACWQFGELDYIDSVKSYQDGIRTRFPLYYKGELLSFQTNSDDGDSQLIDLDAILVIFINGILQEPKVSYTFSGGTSFNFTVAPKTEDNISIFFYRGTVDDDSEQVDVEPILKAGDIVQVYSNNGIPNTYTQNSRVIYNITSADTIETNLYTDIGIDEINLKPLYWTKQKSDLIINDQIVSKARNSIEPQIYPTANIIKSFDSSSNEIFVDDADLFKYDNTSSYPIDAIIFEQNNSNQIDTINNIQSIQGFNCSIVGIATTTGIGAPLALKFSLNRDPFVFPDLQVGYPIYISNTSVGFGVTSINSNQNDIIAISTSNLNNIYYVNAFNPITGILTCNIATNTTTIGIATTGTLAYPVGHLSWGKLSGFTRSSSPISIGISGYTSSIGISTIGYTSGLSTYPIIQRRGYGLRNNGALR